MLYGIQLPVNRAILSSLQKYTLEPVPKPYGFSTFHPGPPQLIYDRHYFLPVDMSSRLGANLYYSNLKDFQNLHTGCCSCSCHCHCHSPPRRSPVWGRRRSFPGGQGSPARGGAGDPHAHRAARVGPGQRIGFPGRAGYVRSVPPPLVGNGPDSPKAAGPRGQGFPHHGCSADSDGSGQKNAPGLKRRRCYGRNEELRQALGGGRGNLLQYKELSKSATTDLPLPATYVLIKEAVPKPQLWSSNLGFTGKSGL